LALSALSLSHPAIKNLLARSLLSTWSFWDLYFLTKGKLIFLAKAFYLSRDKDDCFIIEFIVLDLSNKFF
jgi:hypothetical protein